MSVATSPRIGNENGSETWNGANVAEPKRRNDLDRSPVAAAAASLSSFQNHSYENEKSQSCELCTLLVTPRGSLMSFRICFSCRNRLSQHQSSTSD